LLMLVVVDVGVVDAAVGQNLRCRIDHHRVITAVKSIFKTFKNRMIFAGFFFGCSRRAADGISTSAAMRSMPQKVSEAPSSTVHLP
jgi:hypothetical protein